MKNECSSGFLRGMALTLLITLTANVGAAQSGDCPHVCAGEVPAEIATSPNAPVCGIGFKLFGVGGSVFGKPCPQWEIKTPQHQICDGTPLFGSKCAPEQTLEVVARHCECRGLVLPFLDTGFPLVCRCGDWVPLGSVEDFMSMTCGTSPQSE